MRFAPKHFLTPIFFVLASFTSMLNAQSWSVTNTFEGYFVENNGQFTEVNEWEVLYTAKLKDNYIYFTRKGILFERRDFGTSKEYKTRAKQRKNGLTGPLYSSHFFSMAFTNVKAEVNITPNGLLSHYHNFIDPIVSSKSGRSSCYNKITYEGVWDNIDIEFVLPEKGGLKYNIIVHPGGSVEDISFNYPMVEQIDLLESGDLALQSTLSSFTDKAPVSYLAGNKQEVKSNYVLTGNQLKFKIGDYDPLQTLVIDPWLTIIPTTTDISDGPYDLDYDNFGNVYVDHFDAISKYDASGALVWTFNGFARDMHGDIAVKRSTGEVFVSSGMTMVPSDDAIWKIDASGSLITSFSLVDPGGADPTELWRLRYDNCNGGLIIGAGGAQVQGALLDENFTNPLTTVDFAGAGVGSTSNDVSTMAMDPDGDHCYMLIALGGGGIDNVMYKMPVSSLSPTVWQSSTGHNFQEAGTMYSMANGFNGIACGVDYLYTYGGDTIKQWDKTNGLLIAQVYSGQTANAMGLIGGGIDIDFCGNIYVGAGNVINVYDDGLNLITTYPLPALCYDLIISKSGKLYACGNLFVTEIDISGESLSLSQTEVNCSNCDGTASISGCSDLSAWDIEWSTGSQTTETAVDLCEGWQTIELTLPGNNCEFYLDSIYVGSGGSGSASLGSDTSTCTPPVVLTSTGAAGTYLWQDGSTNTSFTATASGTYWVSIDIDGCVVSDTIIVTVLPAPIIDLGAGGDFCLNEIVLDAQNSGSTYLWQDSSTNQTFVVTTSGNYSVEVDNGDCTSTAQIEINLNPQGASTEPLVPNVFSPNKDQINELFYPIDPLTHKPYFNIESFKIVNRWGNLMYEYSEGSQGWDGTYQGKDATEGVYFYILNFELSCDENPSKTVHGSLSLLR